VSTFAAITPRMNEGQMAAEITAAVARGDSLASIMCAPTYAGPITTAAVRADRATSGAY